MTSEEELAILRELVDAPIRQQLRDLWWYRDNNTYVVQKRHGGPTICSGPKLADEIHFARQKLAAEREAAVTPNERKYKDALIRIKLYMEHVYKSDHHALQLATEALKESP